MNARLTKFWTAFKPWLFARLREPSTYTGLVIKVCGVIGLCVSHDLAMQIASAVAAIVGACLIAWNETP